MRVRTFALTIALAALALVGCRNKAAAANEAEIARLRAEQAELRARIASLEQRATLAQAAPATGAPAPIDSPTAQGPAPANPSGATLALPSVNPLASLLPPTPAPAPIAPAPTVTTNSAGVAMEDLHGQPVSPSTSASGSALLGVPEAQAKPLLDELNRQLETFKAKQAEQQAALDALEKMY